MSLMLVLAGLSLVGARGQTTPNGDPEARLRKLIEAVDVDDNPDLLSPGEGFRELPPSAVPLLKEALKRKDLKWTSRACIAKALRSFEEKAAGLTWAIEFEDRRKEFSRITIDEYRRVGRHDAPWDKAAEAAVAAAADRWGKQARASWKDIDRAFKAAQVAVDAGCDDALVLYILARMMRGETTEGALARAAAHERAAGALEKSRYHPLLRMRGHLTTAELMVASWREEIPQDVRARIREHLESALKHFGEGVAADRTLTAETMLDACKTVLDTWARIGDRREPFQRLHAALEKAQPERAIPHLVAGQHYVEYAWDARGGGWASEVAPEGWALMKERLKSARGHLESAWKIEPRGHSGPTAMISVVLADGSPREEMELWFSRAVGASPGTYGIYNSKLNYLEPKWHGNAEEMLRFGRLCLLAGNWEDQIPFVLLAAHVALAKYSDAGWSPEPDHAYFEGPGVWEDVRALYERYLRLHPDAVAHRTTFAFYAGHARQWKAAHAQFEILGENPTHLGAFRNAAHYAKARAEAAEQAGKP